MFTNLLFGFGLFSLLLLAESGVKRAKKWVLDAAVAAQALHADEDESLGDCSGPGADGMGSRWSRS